MSDEGDTTTYHICSVCGYSRRDVQKVIKHIAKSHSDRDNARVMETEEPPSRIAAAIADFVEFLPSFGGNRRRRR